MKPQPTADDYTAAELADRLRLNRMTVTKMCRVGALAGAYRAGIGRGVWRIPEAAVAAYLESRTPA